jgi:membrane-bound serine protease (ClpP class)
MHSIHGDVNRPGELPRQNCDQGKGIRRMQLPGWNRLKTGVLCLPLLMLIGIDDTGLSRSSGYLTPATAAVPVCSAPGTGQDPSPALIHGRWEGAISPATSMYVLRLLEEAEVRQAGAILLELETPGGLETAMREICQAFLVAPLPVIVYVHPSGARAASAGVFITMSAHVAAMTPGTNIGSAHPVAVGGQMDSTMAEKVTNDSAAFARSIAGERDRNATWAEAAVRESVSATAEEALELGVVDLLADSVPELLRLLDGRVIALTDEERILATSGAVIETIEPTFRERLLAHLADPNIAYILMLLGIYGLIFELQNPGAIFPGVVGAISLVLAFMSFQTLPVNTAGLALIILAVILFILEIKITSYGLLTIGGVISMLLGSLMLFDTVEPAMRLSLGVIIFAVVITTLFFAVAVGLGLRAQARKVVTGAEGLVGEAGRAHTDLDPDGTVAVHGEFWKATSLDGAAITAGTRIEIMQVAGLQLLVRPAAGSAFDEGGEA